jgi:hypothetical protein
MVNDKVEELMLGLEEEQQQSHDDDHRISSAVARGMCSKTYAEKKIAYHTGFKAPRRLQSKDSSPNPSCIERQFGKEERAGGNLTQECCN